MKEESVKTLPTTNKKMPTSLNILIWLVIGTILFLVLLAFWFIVKPEVEKEVRKQEQSAKLETERKCYKSQGLDAIPVKYKCLVYYNYTKPTSLCKERDTSISAKYSDFAFCMYQNGYKGY